MTGIEVISHDGPARLGRFTFEERTISTPAACYLSEERKGVRFFEVGEDSGISLAIAPRPGVMRGDHEDSYRSLSEKSLIKSSYCGEDGEGGDGDCLIVGDGLDLPDVISARCIALAGHERRPADTVERLIELRKLTSPNAAIIIPDARVWEFPLLALVGADILCDSHAVACTLSNRMLFESYTLSAEDAPESPCVCPHCSGKEGRSDADILGKHNRWIVERILSEIRNRIRIGEIKHLAEERALSHPETMAALKGLYRNQLGYLEEFTTIRPGTGTTIRFTDLSVNWAEVVRFRERISQRYNPKGVADCVIVLPCSKAKPYSRSRSHRRFRTVIGPRKRRSDIKEIILTSPLGAIPRELEGLPPARNYDVSVTGVWSKEEIAIASSSLHDVLKACAGSGTLLIAHVDGGYLEVCQATGEMGWDFEFTGSDGPTSTASLGRLSEALGVLEKRSVRGRGLEMARQILAYQFGLEAAGRMTEPPSTAGAKGRIERVWRGERPVARMNPSSGLYIPEETGLEILSDLGTYCVDLDFSPKSKVVYAPGVISADGEIRPGDEVTVRFEGNPIGEGRTLLSGREMTESDRGKAVILRELLV